VVALRSNLYDEYHAPFLRSEKGGIACEALPLLTTVQKI
jgi:hypothetical protein